MEQHEGEGSQCILSINKTLFFGYFFRVLVNPKLTILDLWLQSDCG